MSTPRFGFPELIANQSSPHVPVNHALRGFDAIVQIKAISITNTPPGSPVDGDCYIAGTSPTGLWSGQANAIVYYDANDSQWKFVTAKEGMFAYVASGPKFWYYPSGGPWTVTSVI